MGDWILILLRNSGFLLLAAIIIPLVAGVIARRFVFSLDADDERNNPAKAQLLRERQINAPVTPEPDPLVENPWPDFRNR
jgi:hypothetical protein